MDITTIIAFSGIASGLAGTGAMIAFPESKKAGLSLIVIGVIVFFIGLTCSFFVKESKPINLLEEQKKELNEAKKQLKEANERISKLSFQRELTPEIQLKIIEIFNKYADSDPTIHVFCTCYVRNKEVETFSDQWKKVLSQTKWEVTDNKNSSSAMYIYFRASPKYNDMLTELVGYLNENGIVSGASTEDYNGDTDMQLTIGAKE